jgi:Family of unknown function (DUF6526)
MPQSYSSHAHQPVPTIVAGVFAVAALAFFIGAWRGGWPTFEAGIVSLTLAVMVLISMSRTYIVRLQDRIILLEMKVRCAEVLAAGQDARLNELTTKQVVALRFASDEELGAILDRAIREKLSPDEIKKSIRNWRADNLRT